MQRRWGSDGALALHRAAVSAAALSGGAWDGGGSGQLFPPVWSFSRPWPSVMEGDRSGWRESGALRDVDSQCVAPLADCPTGARQGRGTFFSHTGVFSGAAWTLLGGSDCAPSPEIWVSPDRPVPGCGRCCRVSIAPISPRPSTRRNGSRATCWPAVCLFGLRRVAVCDLSGLPG